MTDTFRLISRHQHQQSSQTAKARDRNAVKQSTEDPLQPDTRDVIQTWQKGLVNRGVVYKPSYDHNLLENTIDVKCRTVVC